jgi:DNA-directed RNA polymerase specialized sigma subunit
MPVNQDLVTFISPGTNNAIDKALHKADPIKFHKRVRGDCPYCGNEIGELTERMKQTIKRIAKKRAES